MNDRETQPTATHAPVRRIASSLLLAALVGLILSAAGCGEPRAPIHVSGPAQGTTFNVTITRAPDEITQQRVQQAMREVIDDIDEKMSTWRDDSEISRFNSAPAGEWVSVSPELASLTQKALDIGHRTGGAFDPTLGPILKVWGFGAGVDAPQRLPDTQQVDAAREHTGLGLVQVRTDPPALRKKQAEVTLDLAGLAQGYTVDRMAQRLDRMGAEHYLVELGGELYARGDKTRGKPWRIGVEKPEAGVRAIDRVVDLENAGMTTSGDYRDFFEIDGHRFSHTIDPRTGRPVAHDLRAVTVIGDNALQADAMATALLVMGPKVGLEYANAHDLAALFVSGTRGAYNESNSKAFEPYLKDSQ